MLRVKGCMDVLLIALFYVPNTGALTVCVYNCISNYASVEFIFELHGNDGTLKCSAEGKVQIYAHTDEHLEMRKL